MAQNLKELIRENYCSDRIDEILGLLVSKIEKELLESFGHFKDQSKKPSHTSETWIGLEPNTLQTPYYEIFELLNTLKEYDLKKFVDLGAGYGRLAFALHALGHDFEFIGHELVPQRVHEGNRVLKQHNILNAELFETDILDPTFKIPKADLYLIYDFSTPQDQRKILDYFSKRMYKEKFFLAARGHGIRSLIQNKYPEFYNCNGVVHLENISIYSSFTELT